MKNMLLVKPDELRSSCRSVKAVAMCCMFLCCLMLALNDVPKLSVGQITHYYPYSQIDSYLIKQLGPTNNESRENLRAASEYLAKLENSGNTPFIPGFMDAIRTFTSLDKILNPELDLETEKCTGEMYKILKKINRITKASSDSKKRVDTIVYHATLVHALYCLPVYPNIFKNKYELLSRLPTERVELSLNPIVQAELDSELEAAKSEDNGYNNLLHRGKIPFEIIITKLSSFYVLSNNYLYSKEDASKIWDSIELMAKKDGKDVLPRRDKPYFGEIDRENARRRGKDLIKEYLIEPCQYYVDQLGEQLFLPAEFDQWFLFYEKKRYQTNKITKDTIDFYYAWARFKLCQNLIKTKKNFKSFSETLLGLVGGSPSAMLAYRYGFYAPY